MMNQNDRAGMSGRGWNISLGILEILLDFIKGITVVGGVLAASIADFVMGAISISILFGANVSLYTSTPSGLLATVISVSASAFQVYLFALIQRRHIGLAELRNWKKIPSDTKNIIKIGGLLWIMDTFTDVAPVLLLVRNSQYQAIPELYYLMVVTVAAIVFMICGFSELLTSNMRTILQVSPAPQQRPQQSYTAPNQSGLQKGKGSDVGKGHIIGGLTQTSKKQNQNQSVTETTSMDEVTAYLKNHPKR